MFKKIQAKLLLKKNGNDAVSSDLIDDLEKRGFDVEPMGSNIYLQGDIEEYEKNFHCEFSNEDDPSSVKNYEIPEDLKKKKVDDIYFPGKATFFKK